MDRDLGKNKRRINKGDLREGGVNVFIDDFGGDVLQEVTQVLQEVRAKAAIVDLEPFGQGGPDCLIEF